MILVSACLLGLKTRYNAKRLPICRKLIRRRNIVPVCPEQLGGLSTPRQKVKFIGGSVFNIKKVRIVNLNGEDVTDRFITGAKETLRIVKHLKIKKAILKSNSPSCGKGGVVPSLLKKHGVKITWV